MEGAPLFNQEAMSDNSESMEDSDEILGEEKRNELAVETGHIAVNPLADDVDFSATDGDDDE